MADKDLIFDRIANALLCDYSSVYYVNAVTNEYMWYSIDPDFRSLSIEQEGEDFFENVKRDALAVVYPEDLEPFLEKMQKERLLSEMKNGMMKSILYRLVIDGKPIYHSLRLIRGISDRDDYFILGVKNVDREMRTELEAQRLEREKDTFNQIARSLAEHYDVIYYVDIETDGYIEFSSTNLYRALEVPEKGTNFFVESKKNLERVVHPDDRKLIAPFFDKKKLLKRIKTTKAVSDGYRLIVGENEYSYARINTMLTKDKKHIMFCVEDINAEVKAERELKATQQKSITYGQIAASLADKYDSIYYIDTVTNTFQQYTSSNEYSMLDLERSGSDFFTAAVNKIKRDIYEEDREKVLDAINDKSFLSNPESGGTISLTYRHDINGEIKYVNMRYAWADDKRHIILGIANIDEQIRREKEQLKAIRTANEKAMSDELTGVRNKNAYQEYEQAVQDEIDGGSCQPFAIVICDLNYLKQINDTLGHKMGDEYIKNACSMICTTFAHSPVFRIGGDEFVAVLKGNDFSKREELLENFRSQVLENCKSGEGPVIASGMAEFMAGADRKVASVFERSDSLMYENKKLLKSNR